MKEKRKKEKRSKKHKSPKKRRRSSTSSSQSDEWVEKEPVSKPNDAKTNRDDWMSMTGMLKTYSKDDIKPKKEDAKKHIDSYNPSTSSRELNPYWKDGGSGVPQTPEQWRKSRPFMKPSDDDDYYTKSRKQYREDSYDKKNVDHEKKHSSRHEDRYVDRKSYNWKTRESNEQKRSQQESKQEWYDNYEKVDEKHMTNTEHQNNNDKDEKVKYLSDEKMNKLAAKIVKAEIMGDTKLVNELKTKLEAAREYRKQNPEGDDGIMLTATTSTGNTRPLVSTKGDPRSKGGKRKSETHQSGERAKYYGNDDKYSLAEMFQEEKYGNNYDNEAQLAKIVGKHTNPNDNLEDIFVDEISKNRNAAKVSAIDKQRAINQHKKIEKSLEGCEYCIDSKNMLKHLIVSMGSKVYVSVPSRKSLVTNQCIISTLQHSVCSTALDEDVWEEVLNYRKALTKFYNSQNKDVLFFETATRLHRFPHIVINCVPMPRDVGDTAPIYFKKALLECEAEWSMNKKVVDLKGKDIRKGIPKGLPYFWVDFGMEPGFAHVIEDQQLFPKSFAEEIVAGILDIEHHTWKNPKKEYGDYQRKKVLDFIKEWKPFDPVA